MRVFAKAIFLLAVLALSVSVMAGKGRLGFTVEFTAQRTGFDVKMNHVVVTQVAKDSPAMRAGLMPGDVIERLNGSVVSGQSGRKLFKAMDAIQAGDIVKVTVLRSGKKVDLSMVAGET